MPISHFMGNELLMQRISCLFELLARFNADDQGYANGQVLDTVAEGVNDGQLTVTEIDGTLALVGNACAFTAQTVAPAWGRLGLIGAQLGGAGFARALGKSYAGIINLSTWEEMGIAWRAAAAVVDPAGAIFALEADGTDGQINKQGGVIVATGLAVDTDYPFHLVLGGYDLNQQSWYDGAVGAFVQGASYFIEIGGEWTLLWREAVGNVATLFTMLSCFDAVGTLDDPRVPVFDYSAAHEPVNADWFTDPNGTSLDVHTPDAGGGWTEQFGEWDIQGNEANTVAPQPASPRYLATVESNISDLFGRVTVNLAAGVNFAGIVFRYVDNSNFWNALVVDAPNTFILNELDGGVSTTRATVGVAITTGVDYEITVTADVQDMQAFLDGANRLSFSSALHQSETITGIRCEDVGARGNNFHVNRRTGTQYDVLDQCS